MRPGGPWAIATAAGKDATLALYRARSSGLDVRWALNVFEGSSDLVRFHGTPRHLVEAHASALGLTPRFGRTEPAEPGDVRPRKDFEAAFIEILGQLKTEGAVGVLFGNLHLREIRDWYEERVRGSGLEHHEPLWGTSPEDVVRAVPRAGFRALVTSVNLELGDDAWLGRELDLPLVEEFLEAGIDLAGEHGEYHTFVHDGPGFAAPVPFRVTGTRERDGHRYLKLEP